LIAACTLACALQGCLSPGDIDDPEAFLARIGRGEGGVADRDGGAGSGGTGANASMSDPCAPVVTDLLKTCQASVCHGNDSSSPLNLQMSGLPARLVGQKASSTCMELPYIDPDSPADSLILEKLTTKPPCGSPMPLGGKTPTDMQRMCMQMWIEDAVSGGSTPTKPTNMDAGTKTDAGTDAGAKMDASTDASTDAGAKMDSSMPASGDMPGLLVGSVDGNPNFDDANPGNMGVDPLGLSKSEDTDWPDNTTLVFTGKIKIGDSGVSSFYENIVDGVRLVIDGTTVLDNGVWNVATAGKIERAAGWYDFELRLFNGTGGSGPSGGMGLGVGYSPMDRGGSTDAADYMHPANSSMTMGDLFIAAKQP
jgi:hypothetical protein